MEAPAILFPLAPLAVWGLEQTDLNVRTMILMGVVLVVLATAWIAGWLMQRRPEGGINPAVVRIFNLRIRAWWTMWAILAAGLIMGRLVTVLLFGLVSFWALREFITMTPTRRGDHRALFWTFFLFTPLQYVLVAVGRFFVSDDPSWLIKTLHLDVDFYGAYSIMIPVYASLLIPALIAIMGDHKRFLERAAKIQAGLLICVYALSYAPALLDLNPQTWNPVRQDWDASWLEEPHNGSMGGLLLYLVLMVQLGDVFHYTWDRLLGRHVIADGVNASKTWEGFIGSVVCTSLCGLALTWVTPFTLFGSACMAGTVAVMGAAGSLTMSAIKRDRGVSDYGTLVTGHAGVLDRIDSLCFAAPVFFHATRFFLHQP